MKPLEHTPYPIASVVRHIDRDDKYFVHDISLDGRSYVLFGCESLGTEQQVWEGADFHLVTLVSPPSIARWNKLLEIRAKIDYMEQNLWQY